MGEQEAMVPGKRGLAGDDDGDDFGEGPVCVFVRPLEAVEDVVLGRALGHPPRKGGAVKRQKVGPGQDGEVLGRVVERARPRPLLSRDLVCEVVGGRHLKCDVLRGQLALQKCGSLVEQLMISGRVDEVSVGNVKVEEQQGSGSVLYVYYVNV